MVMLHRGAKPVVWLLFVVVLLGAGPLRAAQPEKPDVRVLIDISGSMQHNDPDNLRRPALRMLSGLFQPGTRAGVWTFARWVDNLVPVAEVDSAWKKRTQSLSRHIASPGQFTNIEEVLDKASLDWTGEKPTHTRHLVLLTDGMVDVSKKAAENAASRARIIDRLLPRLKADGVRVHTIALSARADHELMRQLAGETGGWYQQVEQAADLQRVFLRMFEKVGQPDTVPLDGNRFVVDGAVNEATVLAFSKPGTSPARLISPSGVVYSDSDLTAGVAWFRDEGYDMITLASPQKGEWVLEADLDPDNRVLIVTDLKLQTSEMPTHIAAGEETPVEASLYNRGKIVTRSAFLRLLDVHAEIGNTEGLAPQPMNDAGEHNDKSAADGRYTMRLQVTEPADEKELVVSVESPTFMREKRFRLVVHEPVDAYIEEGSDGPRLHIALQTAVMQPGATVAAWQEIVPGEPIPLVVEVGADGAWSAPVPNATSPSYVKVAGTTLRGTSLERSVGPIMPEGVEPPTVMTPPPEPDVPDNAESTEEAIVAMPDAAPTEDAEAAADDKDGGWVMPAIIFGAINLLLIVGGGVWFVFKRRAGNAEDDPLDDLITEIEDAAETEFREHAA